MDKTIGISELRESISTIVKEVHEHRTRYIIMQRSKAMAVLVSPEEIERLEVMADKKLPEKINQIKKDARRSRPSSYEDFFGKKSLDRSK